MDHKLLADRLFPHINTTPEDIEARYPKRDLPEGAKVTRIRRAPRASCTSAICTARS